MSDAAPGITFASALSTAAPAAAAAEELVAALTQRLAAPVDLLLVFSSMHHADQLEALAGRLREMLEPRTLLASTCEGVIGVAREVEQGPAVSVIAARLPGVTLEPFQYEQIDWPDVLKSPDALARSIRTPGSEDAARALLLLADPFSTPLVKLLPAFGAAFPGVPVVGGMASGGRKPKQNRLMLNDAVLSDGAVGLAIGGAVDVQTTVSQGCRPVGRPLVITRAQRHVVQELGGHNALRAVQAADVVATLPEPVNQTANYGKNRLHRLAVMAGGTLFGLDLMATSRAVDLLAQTEGVDPQRIGMYGLSQGGQTALYLPAVDTRLRASVCSAYFNTRKNKLIGPCRGLSYLDSHEEDKFFRDVIGCFGDDDLASLIAPRAFAVEAGELDLAVDFEASAAEFVRARAHYKKLGLGDRIEFIPHHAGHVAATARAFDFLETHLGHV